MRTKRRSETGILSCRSRMKEDNMRDKRKKMRGGRTERSMFEDWGLGFKGEKILKEKLKQRD